MYSEEAQEARNKHVRQYRIKYARKTSQQNTKMDQFSYLFITSDSVISDLIQIDIEARQRKVYFRDFSRPSEVKPLLESDQESEGAQKREREPGKSR